MDSINWHTFFFLLFGLVACTFAVALVLTSNVVRMAFYLILSLGATSGLFFLAGADLVGAMQLMIYVGGTVVLLVFGVMLTAQGPFVSMRTSGGDWMLAAVVSGTLLAILLPAAFSVRGWRNDPADVTAQVAAVQDAAWTKSQEGTSTTLGLGLLGARTEKLTSSTDFRSGGLSGYLLPFEIVSVHLLVVLVGAAYLARAKRRTLTKAVLAARSVD